jgi:hypothetical protein
MYPTDLSLRMFRDAAIEQQVFTSGNLMLLVNRGEISGEIPLTIWKFTGIGRELLGLIPPHRDEDYLESLGRFFIERKGTAVLATVLERLPDGRILYDKIRDVSLPPPPLGETKPEPDPA